FAVLAHRDRNVAGGEIGLNRAPEARPAGAGIEFPFGAEEVETATHTFEDAGAVFVEQRASEGAFGAFLSQDVEGRRRQPRAPLVCGQPPPRGRGEAALVRAHRNARCLALSRAGEGGEESCSNEQGAAG